MDVFGQCEVTRNGEGGEGMYMGGMLQCTQVYILYIVQGNELWVFLYKDDIFKDTNSWDFLLPSLPTKAHEI